MKQLFLLLGLLSFVGCDTHTSQPDDGSAVIYIDGKRTQGSAFLDTKVLAGTTYQAVLLETTDKGRIEILGLTFEEGRFIKKHETNSSFPYAFSYLEAAERPRAYMASSGSLNIGVAMAGILEGEFEFEMIDGLSSCIGCEESKGPKMSGTFRAVRSGK